MIRTKEFEIWKAQAAATLVGIPGAATLGAAILGAEGILGAGIQAGILEAIPVGAEVIPTQGVEAEDPLGDEELQRRTLKTTRKCSR